MARALPFEDPAVPLVTARGLTAGFFENEDAAAAPFPLAEDEVRVTVALARTAEPAFLPTVLEEAGTSTAAAGPPPPRCASNFFSSTSSGMRAHDPRRVFARTEESPRECRRRETVSRPREKARSASHDVARIDEGSSRSQCQE